MNRKFYKTRRFRRRAFRASIVMMMIASCASGYVLGATLNDTQYEEAIEVPKVEVIIPEVENFEIEDTEVIEDVIDAPSEGKSIRDLGITAGVATVMDSLGDVEMYDQLEKAVEEKAEEIKEEVANETTTYTKTVNAQIIRCTGYCDYGQTASGEYVREGIIAGKKEWLGRTCNLYRVNEDGTMGELIGSYEFLDTGYGIKTRTSNGVQGSLKLGKSVDVWHPTEDSIWDWMAEYGDYVYIEFTS